MRCLYGQCPMLSPQGKSTAFTATAIPGSMELRLCLCLGTWCEYKITVPFLLKTGLFKPSRIVIKNSSGLLTNTTIHFRYLIKSKWKFYFGDLSVQDPGCFTILGKLYKCVCLLLSYFAVPNTTFLILRYRLYQKYDGCSASLCIAVIWF